MTINELSKLRSALETNSELEDEEIENLWLLIDFEIDRMSITNEMINDAIASVEYDIEQARCVEEYFTDTEKYIDCHVLARDALRDMTNRWVLMSERKPTEADSLKGYIEAYAKSFEETHHMPFSVCKWWWAVDDGVTTHWRKLLPPEELSNG